MTSIGIGGTLAAVSLTINSCVLVVCLVSRLLPVITKHLERKYPTTTTRTTATATTTTTTKTRTKTWMQLLCEKKWMVGKIFAEALINWALFSIAIWKLADLTVIRQPLSFVNDSVLHIAFCINIGKYLYKIAHDTLELDHQNGWPYKVNMIHHVVTIATYCIMAIYMENTMLGVCGLLMEGDAIFLQSVELMKHLEVDKCGRPYLVLNIFRMISTIIFRGVVAISLFFFAMAKEDPMTMAPASIAVFLISSIFFTTYSFMLMSKTILSVQKSCHQRKMLLYDQNKCPPPDVECNYQSRLGNVGWRAFDDGVLGDGGQSRDHSERAVPTVSGNTTKSLDLLDQRGVIFKIMQREFGEKVDERAVESSVEHSSSATDAIYTKPSTFNLGSKSNDIVDSKCTDRDHSSSASGGISTKPSNINLGIIMNDSVESKCTMGHSSSANDTICAKPSNVDLGIKFEDSLNSHCNVDTSSSASDVIYAKQSNFNSGKQSNDSEDTKSVSSKDSTSSKPNGAEELDDVSRTVYYPDLVIFGAASNPIDISMLQHTKHSHHEYFESNL